MSDAPKDEAIHAHLGMVQGVIQRMAGNSTASKTWCITLVSAILVVVATEGTAKFALIGFLPISLFSVLDAYYLSLEKVFRESYDQFVKKIHESTLASEDLYSVAPARHWSRQFFSAVVSLSVWPFYLMLASAVLLVEFLVI